MATIGSVEDCDGELQTILVNDKLSGILQDNVFDHAFQKFEVTSHEDKESEKELILANCSQWININKKNKVSSTAPMTLCSEENDKESEIRRTLRIDRSESTESVVTTSGVESCQSSSDTASEPSSPSRPVTPMPPVTHCSLPFECRDSEDSGLGPSPAKSLINPTSPEGSISPIQFGDDRSDSLLDLSPRTDNSYESSEDHPFCLEEEEDKSSSSIPKSLGSPFQFLLSSNNCVITENINPTRSTLYSSSSSDLSFLCKEKLILLQEEIVEKTINTQLSPSESSFLCEKKSPQFPSPLIQEKDEDQNRCTQYSSPLLYEKKSPQFLPLLLENTTVSNITYKTKSTLSSSTDSSFICGKEAPPFPSAQIQEEDKKRSTRFSSFNCKNKSLQFPSPLLQEKTVEKKKDTQFSNSTDSTFSCEKKSLFPPPLLQEKAGPSFFDEQACRQLDSTQEHSFNNDDHPFAHLNPKVVLIRTNFSGQFSEENSRICHDLTSSDCTSSNSSQVGGSSVDLSSGSSGGGVDDGACKWLHCNRSADANTTVNDLVDHIRQCHVQCQSDEIKSFVCLWVGCKVYDRPSCSRSWLERHILLHGGSKPFRCIVDGCNQRFSSEAVLERHVNSHFPQNKGGHKGERLCRRRRHKHRKRPQSNKAKDFFDEASMEYVKHNLFLLSSVSAGGTLSTVTFRSRVVGRKVDSIGKKQLLLHWSPEDVLPDCWISEADIYANLEKSIPLNKLPPEVLSLPSMAKLLKVVNTVTPPPAKRRRK